MQQLLENPCLRLVPMEAEEKEQIGSDDNWFVLPSEGVTITECALNVFATIAPTHTLFQRGGVIVELVAGADEGLFLDIVSADAFRSRVERYGRKVGKWIRHGKTKELVLVERYCTKETANALLATKEARELLPPVASLVNCPILGEVNGKLEILDQGYHDVCGGVLVAKGGTPTDVCLEKAVRALKEEILGEFDFQTENDRSRAVASLITPALCMGGLLKGNIPLDVAESDKSQSGKTYRHKLIGTIYNEKVSVI